MGMTPRPERQSDFPKLTKQESPHKAPTSWCSQSLGSSSTPHCVCSTLKGGGGGGEQGFALPSQTLPGSLLAWHNAGHRAAVTLRQFTSTSKLPLKLIWLLSKITSLTWRIQRGNDLQRYRTGSYLAKGFSELWFTVHQRRTIREADRTLHRTPPRGCRAQPGRVPTAVRYQKDFTVGSTKPYKAVPQTLLGLGLRSKNPYQACQAWAHKFSG